MASFLHCIVSGGGPTYLFERRVLAPSALGVAIANVLVVRAVAKRDAHDCAYAAVAPSGLGVHVELR